MKPSVALDEQENLERWLAGPGSRAFAKSMEGTVAPAPTPDDLTALLHPVPTSTDIFAWRRGMQRAVEQAEPYFWSKPMCGLLTESIKGLPDWRFDPTMLPTEAGFTWFDQPLTMPGLPVYEGEPEIEIPLRTMLYGPIDARAERWADDGQGQFWGFWGLCLSGLEPRQGGSPTNMVIWRTGETISEVEERINHAHDTSDHDDPRHPGVSIQASRKRSLVMLQYVAAAILLMNQKVFRVTKEEPDRAARKRARRPRQINVLSLRRTRYATRQGDPSPVDWAWQWFVSGHWRHYENGRTPTRIFPYLKGPDGKPLKPKTEQRLWKVAH